MVGERGTQCEGLWHLASWLAGPVRPYAATTTTSRPGVFLRLSSWLVQATVVSLQAISRVTASLYFESTTRHVGDQRSVPTRAVCAHDRHMWLSRDAGSRRQT